MESWEHLPRRIAQVAKFSIPELAGRKSEDELLEDVVTAAEDTVRFSQPLYTSGLMLVDASYVVELDRVLRALRARWEEMNNA